MPHRPLRLPAVALAALVVACADRSPVAPPDPAPTTPGEVCAVASVAPAPASLDPLFAAAAREFDVPVALLKAIGWVETRWQMVEGQDEMGRPPAHGVMALRGAALEQGAALAGATPEQVRTRPEANLRAAAALLRAHADQAGVRSPELAAWAPAVAAYSGIELPEGRASYVHDAVYATLRRGATSPVATLAPVAARPDYPAPRLSATRAAAPDYEPAVWRPSPNVNQRPAGDLGRVAMVIIHTCEGAYTGCWSWLVNPQSQVSAHYVVNEEGTEISQLVREADRGWHIGARYRCALNAELDCWRNDQSSNHFTIGIEHAGFAAQTSFAPGQLEASARLVCAIARRYGITRDNLRIVAHGQLQPENRTDPGRNWPWADYLARIDRHCGGRSPGAALVVDSHDALNDTAVARALFPTGWTAGTSRGFYGTGYYFGGADAAGEPASFSFYLPTPGPRAVMAWWVPGTNRSRRTPFVMRGADGRELGRVEADQQGGGGRWNALGSWNFPAGWNRIQVSRGVGRGCVAVADAVLVH